MIYVERKERPAILDLEDQGSKGYIEYQAALTHFRTNDRAFNFDVYSDPKVKEALIGMFHGKCAYCEREVISIDYGDVEHFRPKQAYRRAKGQDLIYPGYYWLAMDWNNLLLSCTKCNQKYKKNLFPIVDESQRKTTHDAQMQEEPLLIDPCNKNDDPAAHFEYTTAGVIQSKTDKGKTSIQVYGLHRKELKDRREKFVKNIEDRKAQVIQYIQNVKLFSRLPADQEIAKAIENNLRDLKICFEFLHKSVNDPTEEFQGIARKFATDFITRQEPVVRPLLELFGKMTGEPQVLAK
ncbi:hypothetical protein [Paenibacillus sp. GCM10012306]|uniref:hypothetical protein n=1 Tax=Paenibacillus sp. GCM10012306 TaxID=3317342 RepID=UPI00360F2647